MLIYHVVDGLTDSFFPSLSDMDERIDTLQAEIFADPREEQLQEIFAMKQRLVGVRRVIAPQRDMFAQLVGNVVEIPGITDETTRYFRDVYDHLIRLSEMIDSYRDLLTGVIDVYLSTVANRRDQIMKQLTVLAAIFLPITFITGFFGQNFGYMVDHLIGSPHAFVIGTGIQIATVVCHPRVLQAAALDLEGEVERGGDAGGDAVGGERRQAVGLEVAHQEAHGEIRGRGRAERADERRAAHAVAARAEQVGQLEQRPPRR